MGEKALLHQSARALFKRLNEERFSGRLSNYFLDFSDRMIHTHGKIDYHSKTITLSSNLLEQYGWPAVENTLLHEMIHALLFERGYSGRHNKTFWKEFTKRGGIRDKIQVTPSKVHIYVCPSCGNEVERINHIRKAKLSCALCDKEYNPTHTLVYRETHQL